MRAGALSAALLALLGGCEGRGSEPAAAPPALPPCRPGDLARTAAGPTAFSAGWVQLKLAPCPGARGDQGATLMVESSTHSLTFQQGRTGAETTGVLAAGAPVTDGGAVGFELPGAYTPVPHTLVLAPWSGRGSPPSLGGVRVTSRASSPEG